MRFASRWVGYSCIFVAAFTVLLGTAVWWLLTYVLPSALRPPSDRWKAELLQASRKHFACNPQQLRAKVIGNEKASHASQPSDHNAQVLVDLFLQLPKLLDTHPVVAYSVLEYGDQRFRLYHLPVSVDVRGMEAKSLCFGLDREGYVKMVILKTPASVPGVAGADFLLMKFETMKLKLGCIVPDTVVMEFHNSTGKTTSELLYSTRLRIEYD